MKHNDKRVALDVATFFKVVPWIMMKPDRDLQTHVKGALQDSMLVLERGDTEARKLQLRGMIHNFSAFLGRQMPPNVVEAIVAEVIKQVDQVIEDRYDDGLGGDPA